MEKYKDKENRIDLFLLLFSFSLFVHKINIYFAFINFVGAVSMGVGAMLCSLGLAHAFCFFVPKMGVGAMLCSLGLARYLYRRKERCCMATR